MASAFRSFGTVQGEGTTVTIPKPSGLAVGDMMVAVVRSGNGATTAKTGWSSLAGTLDAATTTSNTNNFTLFQFKKADASDVAASNFVWTTTSGEFLAHIYAFSGVGDIPSFAGPDEDTTSTATPTFQISVTPDRPCMLLFIVGHSANGTTVGSYAVVTDNPTWTEIADATYDPQGNDALGLAAAYGPRTAVTATGNASCTFSGVENRYLGTMIVLRNQENITNTPSPVGLVASVPTPAVVGHANVTVSPSALTGSIPSPITATVGSDWINDDASTLPSYTNDAKS